MSHPTAPQPAVALQCPAGTGGTPHGPARWGETGERGGDGTARRVESTGEGILRSARLSPASACCVCVVAWVASALLVRLLLWPRKARRSSHTRSLCQGKRTPHPPAAAMRQCRGSTGLVSSQPLVDAGRVEHVAARQRPQRLAEREVAEAHGAVVPGREADASGRWARNSWYCRYGDKRRHDGRAKTVSRRVADGQSGAETWRVCRGIGGGTRSGSRESKDKSLA